MSVALNSLAAANIVSAALGEPVPRRTKFIRLLGMQAKRQTSADYWNYLARRDRNGRVRSNSMVDADPLTPGLLIRASDRIYRVQPDGSWRKLDKEINPRAYANAVGKPSVIYLPAANTAFDFRKFRRLGSAKDLPAVA